MKQTRRLKLSIPLIVGMFKDGSMQTLRIDRGVPQDFEILKMDRISFGTDFSIQVLITGTFQDGGSDGDLFDILVTQVHS